MLNNKRNICFRSGTNYRYMFMRADGPQLESLNPLIEQHIIRPIVDSVFPFAQTAEAVARSEGGKARGKVIIQMRDD